MVQTYKRVVQDVCMKLWHILLVYLMVKVASLTNSGPNIERESARPTSSGTYELR